MYARGLAALALIATTACASSSSQSEPADRVTRVDIDSGQYRIGSVEMHNDGASSSTVLPLSADSVWAALPRAYEVLEIPGTGVAPEGEIYGARNARPRRIEGKRLSTFLDCGQGPSRARADEYQVTMTVLSTVEPTADGSAGLETIVAATARPRAVAGNPITCQSNGVLEMRIAELVVWALASGR